MNASGEERIADLLLDDSITELMVDGAERIYVERRGKLEDVDIHFASDQQVIDWANHLLTSNGHQPVSAAHPMVEGRLRDGSYLLAVVPPVAVERPHLVFLKNWKSEITLDLLLEYGAITPQMLEFFKEIMRSRLNMVVAGGTASGKTTLARLLVELIPAHERVILVGQGAFPQRIMRLVRPHLVCLESPAGGGLPGVGELLRLASRMRPDRIICGDVSGDETREAVQLMNSGHDGTLLTLHANTPRDVLTRLEMQMSLAEPGLALPGVRAQLADALDLIVVNSRLEDGSRKIIAVAQVVGLKGDHIILEDIFSWQRSAVDAEGRILGAFHTAEHEPRFNSDRAAGLRFAAGIFKA
jgi:pilus assembly protein CpaF